MASGDRFGILSPLGSEPPSSAFATIDTRNSRPVLDFDAATDESAVWSFPPPATLTANTGLRINLACAMTSATSGNVVVRAQIERNLYDTDSAASDSFGTGNQVTVAAPATAGVIFNVQITLSNTQVDGLTSSDPFRVRITRLGTNASDNAAGDMELITGDVAEQ